MMGNLFYRGVQPSEIKAMGYSEMKFWNDFHDLMVEAEQKEIAKAEKRNAKGK